MTIPFLTFIIVTSLMPPLKTSVSQKPQNQAHNYIGFKKMVPHLVPHFLHGAPCAPLWGTKLTVESVCV